MSAYGTDRTRAAWGMVTSSPLAGTGLIADDLWLAAHHERTGRAYLPPRTLGIGLAGGLLAELLLAECISLTPDALVCAGRAWPREALTAHLRSVIAAEPGPRPVRDWLLFAARGAPADVGIRLERAGFVCQARSSLPPWRSRRVPVDPNTAFSALVRVGKPRDVHGAVLAVLAGACGLTFRLTAAGYSPVPGEAARLVPFPVLDLMPHVESAVASAVLAQRT